MTSPARILLPILDEHFLELDILWERREAGLGDTELTGRELAELEQRAQRHLDGLLLGPEYALELARRALAADERGAATAAGFVMMDLGDPVLAEELVRALAVAAPEAAHGIRIALRHRDVGPLAPSLRELAGSLEPVVQACACDVLAYHRLEKIASVRDLLTAEDEEVRALASGAIGRWQGPWTADDLRAQLAVPGAPLAHRAALETSARLSLRGLLEACRDAAYREADPSLVALAFLGVIGDAGEVQDLQRALERPDLAPAALAALGALGSPQGVPAILDALGDPLLAHAAAGAFLRITGAEDVKGEPAAPPAELDEAEAEFWDEHVPAEAALARRWWQENAARFTDGIRWQQGVAESETITAPETAMGVRRDAWLRSLNAGEADARSEFPG